LHLAHKIRLNPTKEQENYFIRAAGVHRFVFNWALAEWKRQYENGETPSAYKLKKEFNAIKHNEFPFISEVHRDCSSQPFADLEKAFVNFFRRVKRGDGKPGYPNFKSKKKGKTSFYLASDKFSINENWIRIPRLGWVNMAESLRLNGKILSARVSKDGSHWFVAIVVEIKTDEAYYNNLEPVGIDLGIKTLLTFSDGVVAENQRITLRHAKRLRMLNKKLSRQTKGSNNWQKTVNKIRTLNFKIKSQREDYVHKWTRYLASNYGFIAVEDLNVSGMIKNHSLSKHIADASFSEIIHQLEYKQHIYGSVIQKISRWFPSSKTCSSCGWIDENLTLDKRVFVCNNCNMILDRDKNAAINIKNEGLRLSYEQSSSAVASSA
jgi:putative transposase